jgi:hypothetical protein
MRVYKHCAKQDWGLISNFMRVLFALVELQEKIRAR